MQPTRHNLDIAQLWRLPTCACSTQMVSCGNLSALKTSVNLKPEIPGNQMKLAHIAEQQNCACTVSLKQSGHVNQVATYPLHRAVQCNDPSMVRPAKLSSL